MKEKFITDTLKAKFMQQNASRGRQWACFGIVLKIRCIVVKNPDVSWVEIKNFCPCTDQVCCLARSPKARSLQVRSRKSKKEERFSSLGLSPCFRRLRRLPTCACSHSTVSHTPFKTASSLQMRTYVPCGHTLLPLQVWIRTSFL